MSFCSLFISCITRLSVVPTEKWELTAFLFSQKIKKRKLAGPQCLFEGPEIAAFLRQAILFFWTNYVEHKFTFKGFSKQFPREA